MKKTQKIRALHFDTPQPLQSKARSLQKYPRSINSRCMETPWGFTISNRKKVELYKIRTKQIELQDKSLTSRIEQLKQHRKRSQHSDNEATFFMKPLHQSVRKEHIRLVKEANSSQKKWMESLKGTIDNKQIEKDWNVKQNIRRFVSKHERQSRNKESLSIDSSVTQGRNKGAVQNRVRFKREREMNGKTLDIMIEEYSHVFIISGKLTIEKDCVVMVIESKKMQNILRSQCKGKLEIFVCSLQFNPQINSLYFLTDDPSLQHLFISDTCSEFDLITLRKAILSQHQLLHNKLQPRNTEQSITIQPLVKDAVLENYKEEIEQK